MSPSPSEKRVKTTTPCRLHFGLINCGVDSPDSKSFGGVGAMIDNPGIEISAQTHEQLEIVGDNVNRVRQFAKLWFEHAVESEWIKSEKLEQLPVRIDCKSPRNHIGLGIGTQLALTTATTLCHFFSTPADVDQLARMLKRGRRSAIGIQGFKNGGFIFESGKSVDADFGALEFQNPLPESWHVVLVMNDETLGKHGAVEEDVFRNPVNDPKLSQALERMIREQIVPAVDAEDFKTFSHALHEYGKLSGSLFADQQGGAYNGQVVQTAVEAVLSHGIHGVGQSSWGPTVFAVTESLEQAQELVGKLESQLSNYELMISGFNSRGAKVHIE